MKTNDSRLLFRTLCSVFQEFAFMFVEEDTDCPQTGDNPCPCLLARIHFSGPDKKGFLEIAAPAMVCEEIAENVLGLEHEELPENAGQNALTELLNVLCGYFLAEKFGTEEVFDLSVPGIRQMPDAEWRETIENDGHIRLLVDESPLVARVAFEK
ncbi:MAG: chemotaxis protein CheX [Desulfobacterales bacterium]